jgi:hypothetical protein
MEIQTVKYLNHWDMQIQLHKKIRPQGTCIQC